MQYAITCSKKYVLVISSYKHLGKVLDLLQKDGSDSSWLSSKVLMKKLSDKKEGC